MDVWIRRNPMIPTHAAVGIKLSRNAMRSDRSYARTLPSLKTQNQDKIKKEFENLEDEKELADKTKEDKERLHTKMDEVFEGVKEKMSTLLKKKDLAEYWKTFSMTVEKSMD